MKDLGELKNMVHVLTNRMVNAEGMLAAANGDCGGHGGGGGLVDKRFFEPEKFAMQKQIFKERAKEFYQLVSRHLILSCFAHYKQIDTMNGFNMWRPVNRAKGPICKMSTST